MSKGVNMEKIFNSFMKDGTRPQMYNMGYDLIKIQIPH